MTVRTLSHRVDDSTARVSARFQSRLAARAARGDAAADAGMTTAEYAVGTVAACGFAGLLVKLLTGTSVTGLLTKMIFDTVKHYLHFS